MVNDFFSSLEFDRMKWIVFVTCGMLLLVANTAEARRSRNRGNYVPSAPVVYAYKPVLAQPASVTPAVTSTVAARPASVASATSSTVAAQAVRATSASLSTQTAQGVANIMASCGYVGHWGGNPGYEGCGMGATPEAAYNICCYANSGMATVDVGYAQGANGMWFCCRRYR
jgi:hypothetical protein